ncbi:MAG: SIR2 family protein [Paludibacteraceae bacterium]|nr:SIR2 family protein [Paludibacteraceae bacterium]
MDSVPLLKQLRSDYASRKLSALVGAGFSRNALPAFPLWRDLLLPIVKDVYKQEFEALLRYHTARAKTSGMTPSECAMRACDDILLKYGNLEVVSEYIRRNGMGHESIDAYIEQHIKPAERKGNGWTYDGKRYKTNRLQTHMDLLQCRYFRHIYTTNYDNLLEIAQELNPSGDTIRVVTDEVGLSDLAMQRAIVKLHGDISRRAGDEYVFDGDKNLKYIIAKEDYENYMQKHQGFSYLMRLEMLQGRFCLFGFSGSDPNYMMWLQWMKDILDKEQRKAFRSQEDSDVKVYMIQPFANVISEAASLYYKNHHVGVINLTDDAVIHEMQKTLNEAPFVSSAKFSSTELLQLLFRYLRSAQKEITHPDFPAVTDEYADKYQNLWKNLDEAIAENRNPSDLLSEIDKAYDAAKIPANVAWQEDIIHRIIHRQEVWNKEISHIFALAVRDKGEMPGYYRQVIPDSAPLHRDNLWKKLRRTENVFMSPLDAQEDDSHAFMQLMAAAFSLDFDRMYALLKSWRPAAHDRPKKWMLLSLFNQRDANVTALDDLVAKTQDELDRMNLCVMRNLQSRDWPHRYDIRAYAKRGLKSTLDILQTVAHRLNEPQTKRRRMPYGIVSNSFSWERGNRLYESSMRVVSLLYDNAYVPSYYHVSLLPEEEWYDVFTHLYERYPYPLIYYSSFLTNDNLLRRMGQDLAFSEVLYSRLPEILRRMLLVFRRKRHPAIVENGLLIMSAELYTAVPEDDWYPLFRDCLLPVYCAEVLPGEFVRESWTPNVRAAIACVKKQEHVNELFTMLMTHFDDNPGIVASLCVTDRNLSRLSVADKTVRQTISGLVEKGSLKQYHEIYYVLAFYDKLSLDDRRTIARMLETEDLAFCNDNENSLFQLAALARTPQQIALLKNRILQLPDIFNCGIYEDHRTEPSPFYINDLPDTFVWTQDELRKITANMMRNLEKMRTVKMREEDLFLNSYLNLLVMMIRFMTAHHSDMPDWQKLERLLWTVVTGLTGASSLQELFYSKHYFTLNVGYYLLVAGLAGQITQRERACVDIIITRVMMKDSGEYQTLAGMLSALVTDFPHFMLDNYKDELIGVLREGMTIDYRALELNLVATYAAFIRLAQSMHRFGIRNEFVRRWLSEQKLQRFAHRLD